MSEVHVHGVVSASEPDGAAPAGTRRISHGEIAAIVSDVAPDTLATRLLRAHWQILEALGATATVLPVRFGTALADEQAVVDDFLTPRHDGLAATLAGLAGKVQLTVKGFYAEEALMRDVVERSPAVARLRERVRVLSEAAGYYERIRLGELVAAEVDKARERDTALVLERLEPLAVAVQREPPSAADMAVNAAFLVEREQMDDFSGAVARLGEELAGRMWLRFVGPLPPFSFAGEDTTAGAATWA
jgi:hypothetical protein